MSSTWAPPVSHEMVSACVGRTRQQVAPPILGLTCDDGTLSKRRRDRRKDGTGERPIMLYFLFASWPTVESGNGVDRSRTGKFELFVVVSFFMLG